MTSTARQEAIKIINTILLAVITVVIGFGANSIGKVNDKLDNVILSSKENAILIRAHNEEAWTWKERIQRLEDEVKELKEWANDTFEKK